MTAHIFPPLEIDPRKVERLTRYIVRHAHLHATDPLDYQRRYLAGLRFQMRLRCRPSRFQLSPAPALLSSVDSNRRKA